jgi:heptosyltransferase-2
MSVDQRTVLVVGPSWVGDMVLAQVFFRALREQGGVAALDVVAPPGAFPILERVPEVRDAFLLRTRHGRLGLAARWRLARQLRSRGYDQAYVLPSSLKSALLPALAGVRVRTGYRGEMRFGLINDVRPNPAAERSDRNVRGFLGLLGSRQAAVDTLPPPRLRVDRDKQRQLVTRLGLSTAAPVVALAPGAAHGPAKRWPAERYRALAARLTEAGRTVWILGGPDERPLGEEIARSGGDEVRDLCGVTTLSEAVDLLALADVTVANDSGLAHVAAAAGSPVVVLFGPTSPDFAAPLTDRSELLYRGLECSPCFERSCPLGHHRCMTDIAVEEVMRRVDRLAAARPLPDWTTSADGTT